jgi:hypothetical protein
VASVSYPHYENRWFRAQRRLKAPIAAPGARINRAGIDGAFCQRRQAIGSICRLVPKSALIQTPELVRRHGNKSLVIPCRSTRRSSSS